jgi:isoleucyl-tRNA synthetase
MAPFVHLLQDELNVKKVEFAADIAAFGGFRLQVDAKSMGPVLGAKMKDVLAATKTGAWKLHGDRAEIGGCMLEKGQYVLQLVPKDGITAAALSTNDVVLVLDTNVTPALEAEGSARDFVRLVQQARKDAGLHVSDRIELWVATDAATQASLQAHISYVQEQVLAVRVSFAAAKQGAFAAEGKVGSGAGAAVVLGLQKA